jgi:type II secretion system protein J
LNTKSLERGFTLIEVLVALVLVSLLSLLAWRALDGMGRAGEFTLSNEQSLQRVQTGLAQWTADLDHAPEQRAKCGHRRCGVAATNNGARACFAALDLATRDHTSCPASCMGSG